MTDDLDSNGNEPGGWRDGAPSAREMERELLAQHVAALLRAQNDPCEASQVDTPPGTPLSKAKPVRSVAAAARVLHVRRAAVSARLLKHPVQLHGTRPQWTDEDAVRAWWFGDAASKGKQKNGKKKRRPQLKGPPVLSYDDWED